MDKTAQNTVTYDLCARTFAEKFMDLRLYREQLDFFCELLPPAAHILDLGCGPGNIAKLLLEKEKGFQVYGVDLSGEMVKLAQQYAPQGIFAVGDLRNVPLQANDFDAVVASFCIVHLTRDETLELMRKVQRSLKPNGLLYLSFMLGQASGYETTSYSNGNTLYFHYYTEEFMHAVLPECGLEVIHTFEQEYTQTEGPVPNDIFMIARKRK